MNQNPGAAHTAMILVVVLVVLAIVAMLFVLAGPIARLLGRTGTMVMTRLFGMLLAALSMQFVIDGLKGSGLV
ncbi:inner membrane protein [compost metagenome]